jgi:hypothetical protein
VEKKIKNFLKILKKVLAFFQEVCYYIGAEKNSEKIIKISGCGEVWYRA